MVLEESKLGSLDDIWQRDHLDRRVEVAYLSKYLANRYQAKPKERGFVLAVNADWGVGKTFMVRNWCKQAEFEQHPAVCFDAWSNDFSKDPLIGFIAELDAALKQHFASVPAAQEMRRELLASVKQVLLPGAKVLGAAMSKKLLGLSMEQVSEYLTSVGDDADNEPVVNKEDLVAVGKDLSKAMEDALKAHQSTAKAIQTFKDKFALLIEALRTQANIQLPVYVFVDELDRCRPDYAIALLEGIKHLFGVPGLYFVIATNIEQLAHSIKAVYGESFDAVRYLKRFFDLEFSLPKPDTTKFASELLSRIASPVPDDHIWGFNLTALQLPSEAWLPYTFVRYARAFRLELRDMEQASHMLEACFLTLKRPQIHMHFLIFLVMLYQRDTALYDELRRSKHLTPGVLNAIDGNADLKFAIPLNQGSGAQQVIAYISISDIIEPYMKALRGDTLQPHPSQAELFPFKMAPMINQAQGEDALRTYLEIVPRAGCFA